MKKTTKKDEFELTNLPKECQDPSISKDDFKLVQVDAKIHDQKFETKPTTFLKDCIKRFRKNKSSVVAAFILGILVLLSLVVPIVFKTSTVHDTSVAHPELYYLEPRLFNAGSGFWDGTKKMTDIVVDTRDPDPKNWGPDAEIYNPNAVSDLKIGEEQYIDTANQYAHGGYLQLGYFEDIPNKATVPYISYSTALSVAQMIQTEEKVVIPDIPVVRENLKKGEGDTAIKEVYAPTSLEQKSLVDVNDFTVDVYYDDPENPNDGKDGAPWSVATVPVDTVDLSTNRVGVVEGSVHYNGYSKKFNIEITEKQPKELTFDQPLTISNFVTLDKNKLSKSDEKTKTYPKGYAEAKSALYLRFEQSTVPHEIALTGYKSAHDIGKSEPAIDVQAAFADYCATYSLSNKVTDIQLEIRVENSGNKKNSCTLIESIKIESGSSNKNEKKKFESFSFTSGNDIGARTNEQGGLWIVTGTTSAKYTKIGTYLVKAVLCSFVYDTYEAVLGHVKAQVFKTELEQWVEDGGLEFNFDFETEYVDGEYRIVASTFHCKIVDAKKCALAQEFKASDVVLDPSTSYQDMLYVNAEVFRYKMDPYYLSSMPRFLMGTDKSGKDMFIYVFEGLRTSLLLGIATSAVCFLFGLLWGSIAGYFGGNVDLIMERLTDILSGIPWIVVMTLTIIHLGSTFITFAIALCLTGWIGTAATTRTQFYRFRGREYVLASRTLGASHARLITKHILPNAMGTIITSAVLMVPSIIFSEATISYLGLGFKNLASLGVILSDNQVELTNHPYLLIFPAVIIALLMISFNLFGNGLRDAVNPSLKGEGE